MAFISNSITGSIRGNSVGTASFSISSSFSTTSSFSISASRASSSLSASYAATASFAVALVNPVVGGAIISSSIPTLQPSGTLWFNTDDGNTYVQVSGSSGSVYVPAMASVAGSTFGATFRGSYSGATWTVQHNLGTTAPIIQVYSGSAVMIPASIVSTDANTSTITFASAVNGSVVASTGVGGATTASLALNTIAAVSASVAATASFIPSFEWISAGTCSISATTTAPTKGTIVQDNVRYRRVNSTSWEVEYKYAQSTVGSAGSGTYLFSLPSAISFGASVLLSTAPTVEDAINRGLPAAAIVAYNGSQRPLVVVPRTTTSFQLVTMNSPAGLPNAIFSSVNGDWVDGLSLYLRFYVDTN